MNRFLLEKLDILYAWLSSRGHSYPHVPQTPLGISGNMNILLADTHEKKKRLLFLSLAAKASDTNQVFTPREFAIQRKKCLFDPSFFHGGSDGWTYQNLTNALRLGRERIVLTIIFFLLSNSIRMLYSFSTFICVGGLA